jgi:hypothetical protein
MALLLGACSIAGPSLPGGYAVRYADRGKAWLANPDGTLAHGALIKELYSDDRHILLISFAETIDGEVGGPRPLDGNCYVALMIDSQSRQMGQVRLYEAKQLASRMSRVESYDRGCLQGMATA